MPTSATVLTEVDVGCATMCCVLLGPQEKKKEEITDHANPEENGPQRAKERGRRAAQGHPNQSSGAGSTTEAEGAQLDGVHACLSACVHQ